MRAFMFVALVAAGPLANVAAAETVLTSISGRFGRVVAAWFPEDDGYSPGFQFGIHPQTVDEFVVGSSQNAEQFVGVTTRFEDAHVIDAFRVADPSRDRFFMVSYIGDGYNGWIFNFPISNAFVSGTYVGDWHTKVIDVTAFADIESLPTMTAILITLSDYSYTEEYPNDYAIPVYAFSFQVDLLGTVPEPSSMVSLLSCIAGSFGLGPRRVLTGRRRRSSR
jgi:hypothetical protein